jgi:hypothetical protein
VPDARRQQHELVATEARERVVAPRSREQARGRFPKQLVTEVMAQRVVDGLEPTRRGGAGSGL